MQKSYEANYKTNEYTTKVAKVNAKFDRTCK